MLMSAVFWLWVSMAVFIAVAGRPAGRAVVAMLDRQRDLVRKQIEETTRLRAEAEATLNRSVELQAEAEAQAARIVAEAEADAARIRAEDAERLRQSLAQHEKQAMDRIAEAEASALRDVRTYAAALALAASREVIRNTLSPTTADLLVDQAIAEIPAKIA